MTLRERLRDGAWPSWKQRCEWAVQLCQGLVFVHASEVCHGDLKTSNLLLDDLQVLKIADFGMTIAPSCGTPPYSAPEQAASGVPSMEADIYAVGIILVELMQSYDTEMERSRSLELLKSDLSAQPPMIQSCLDRAAQRPTAAQLVKELKELEQMIDH